MAGNDGTAVDTEYIGGELMKGFKMPRKQVNGYGNPGDVHDAGTSSDNLSLPVPDVGR